MRSKKNVYDFNDFEKIIESKGCKQPKIEGDFYDWENGLSQENFASSMPLLCDVIYIYIYVYIYIYIYIYISC